MPNAWLWEKDEVRVVGEYILPGAPILDPPRRALDLSGVSTVGILDCILCLAVFG